MMPSHTTRSAGADHGLSMAHETALHLSVDGGVGQVNTALRRRSREPLDGIGGIRGVHCAGLASTGVKVVSAVTNDAAAQIAKDVYARAAPSGSVDIRVVPESADLFPLAAERPRRHL